jgi:hypothetical protein
MVYCPGCDTETQPGTDDLIDLADGPDYTVLLFPDDNGPDAA